jgi:hypothetical protein
MDVHVGQPHTDLQRMYVCMFDELPQEAAVGRIAKEVPDLPSGIQDGWLGPESS